MFYLICAKLALRHVFHNRHPTLQASSVCHHLRVPLRVSQGVSPNTRTYHVPASHCDSLERVPRKYNHVYLLFSYRLCQDESGLHTATNKCNSKRPTFLNSILYSHVIQYFSNAFHLDLVPYGHYYYSNGQNSKYYCVFHYNLNSRRIVFFGTDNVPNSP